MPDDDAGQPPSDPLPWDALTPADHFVGALGVELSVEGDAIVGRTEIRPAMVLAPTTRLSMGLLATMVDLVGGHTLDGPVNPTIDLRITAVGDFPRTGQIELIGRPLKAGNRLIVSEGDLRDDAGARFARATTTFMNNKMPVEHSVVGQPRTRSGVTSFEDLVGASVVDNHTLAVTPHIRISNGPGRTVQGGAQAFVAELTAAHALGRPPSVRDLDIRYLNRVKTGPLHARAEVRPPHDGLQHVQVTLYDAGAEDRIVGFVVLICDAATA